tara:strand:+ start:339 stop:1508 length:1170 start_codon:yes stop_codon:yes gene_type:complete
MHNMAIDGDSALENVLNLIQSSVQTGLTKGEEVLQGALGPAYEPIKGLAQFITPDISEIYKAGEQFIEQPSPAALTAVVMAGALESPVGKAGKVTKIQKIVADEKKLDEFKDQYKKQYGVSQKQKQKPEVKEAVEKRLAGEITGKEQRDITKKFLPLEPITKMVKVPTFEDIAGSLTKDKTLSKGIINLNTELEVGQRVSSRLDIPAYENFDTWVVSFHDGTKQGGKSIGYGKTANLTDVDFSSSAKAASNIAKEKTAKSTIARMYGDYNKVPDEDVVARSKRILAGKVEDSNKYIDPEDGSEWIQVGMNPYRASYFVDKNTGTPLKSAEEMIQVGPLVFAKGSQRLKPSDFKKDKSLTTRTDTDKIVPFKKGGSIVERNPYNYTPRMI